MFTFLVVAFLATGILKAAVGDKFTVDGIEYVILSEDPNEVAVGESVSFGGTTANIPATVMNGATTYSYCYFISSVRQCKCLSGGFDMEKFRHYSSCYTHCGSCGFRT